MGLAEFAISAELLAYPDRQGTHGGDQYRLVVKDCAGILERLHGIPDKVTVKAFFVPNVSHDEAGETVREQHCNRGRDNLPVSRQERRVGHRGQVSGVVAVNL